MGILWEFYGNSMGILWEFYGNPQIFSAMAMAMSIYRTLCVLVFRNISLLEMPTDLQQPPGDHPLTSH